MIVFDKSVIDVEERLALRCDILRNENQGNPEATTHSFRNNNGWEVTNPDSYDFVINSVMQEAEYSCAGINYPKAFPDSLEGIQSETKPLVVLGEYNQTANLL